MQFNDYLVLNGSNIEVRINRAANTLKVRIQNGSVDLDLPRYGRTTLWSGDDFEFTLDGSGQLTNLLREHVETPLRSKGIDVTIDRAKLLLGSDRDQNGRPIYGIEIFGSLKLNILGLINVPLSFNKLVFTQNEGMRFSGDIGPINFNITDAVRVKDLYVGFVAGPTKDQDVFRGQGKVELLNTITAGGAIEIQGGQLNNFTGDVEFPAGISIPLGPVSPTGGVVELKNLLDLRNVEVFIGADLTLGPFPALNAIVGLDNAGFRYQAPAQGSRTGGRPTLRRSGVARPNRRTPRLARPSGRISPVDVSDKRGPWPRRPTGQNVSRGGQERREFLPRRWHGLGDVPSADPGGDAEGRRGRKRARPS